MRIYEDAGDAIMQAVENDEEGGGASKVATGEVSRIRILVLALNVSHGI